MSECDTQSELLLNITKAQIDADIHDRVFCPSSVSPLTRPSSASAFPLCGSVREEAGPSVALGLGGDL